MFKFKKIFFKKRRKTPLIDCWLDHLLFSQYIFKQLIIIALSCFTLRISGDCQTPLSCSYKFVSITKKVKAKVIVIIIQKMGSLMSKMKTQTLQIIQTESIMQYIYISIYTERDLKYTLSSKQQANVNTRS